MHSLWTTLAIVALSWCAAGQDPADQEPLKVMITPASTEPVDVEIGDKLDIWTCEINRGVTFGLVGQLEWLHKSSDGTEHLIAEKKNVMAEMAEHYAVDVEYDMSSFMKSRLTIKSVRAEDNGEWICRATVSGGSSTEATKMLNIIHDMDGMEMTVGSEGPYTNEVTDAIAFNEGTRGVRCDVKGGNPEATITLTLDGKDVQLDEVNSMKIADAALPSFHTTGLASVELTGDHTDKVITCTGQVGKFPARSVGVRLDIVTFSPTIHCQNKTTSKGDKFVQANCVVSFTKPIKNVSLEVGDSNTVIQANTDYSHGDTKFLTRPLNATAMEVTIDVYQMMEEHFRHVYYVNVLGHDNKRYREPIIFINAGLNDSNGASSLCQHVLFSLFGCLVVLGLLQRLHW